MSITASIVGARSLWTTSGKLGLGLVDRVKYALSWYLSRHALLAMVAPAHFVMQLPGRVQAPIRPNGVDCKTLTDIFGNRIYLLQADSIKRVLDLGANIGATTLFLASRFPEAEFACVEPFPGNQAVLRETIRLNHIHATVFDGAIGTDAGEADLYVGCEADMYSLTPKDLSAQKIRVRKFTVPEILASLGWDEVDLLKIDIEGYEKTLLHENNVWLNKVRVIIGEAHGHVGYRIGEVRADLAPFGFKVTQNSFDSESGLTMFEARKS
jgi:FkbM family methyltransferase